MRWITHIAVASLFVKLLEISLLVDLTSRYEFWVVLSLYAVMADFDSLLGIKHRTYSILYMLPYWLLSHSSST